MFVSFAKQSYAINMLCSEPLQLYYTCVHGILFIKTGKSKPVFRQARTSSPKAGEFHGLLSCAYIGKG